MEAGGILSTVNDKNIIPYNSSLTEKELYDFMEEIFKPSEKFPKYFWCYGKSYMNDGKQLFVKDENEKYIPTTNPFVKEEFETGDC